MGGWRLRSAPIAAAACAAIGAAAARSAGSRAAMASTMARCSCGTASMKSARVASLRRGDAHRLAQVLLEEARAGGRSAGCRRPRRSRGGRPGLRRRRRAARRRCGRWPAGRGAARRPGRGGALGGQRGDLALEHAPHLAHVHHVVHRVEHARSKVSGWFGGAAVTKTPEPWRRAQQAARLQLVHGLAHHGARDAVRRGELLLGRQAVAGAQACRRRSARAEPRRQPVGQPLGDERSGDRRAARGAAAQGSAW